MSGQALGHILLWACKCDQALKWQVCPAKWMCCNPWSVLTKGYWIMWCKRWYVFSSRCQDERCICIYCKPKCRCSILAWVIRPTNCCTSWILYTPPPIELQFDQRPSLHPNKLTQNTWVSTKLHIMVPSCFTILQNMIQTILHQRAYTESVTCLYNIYIYNKSINKQGAWLNVLNKHMSPPHPTPASHPLPTHPTHMTHIYVIYL